MSAQASTRPANAGTNEESIAEIRDWYLMWRLLQLLAPHWVSVFASLLCSLISMVLQITSPLILSLAIDVYFLKRAPELKQVAQMLPSDPFHGITVLSIWFTVVLVLTTIIDSAQNFLAQWTGQMAMADLRRKLMLHLHQLPINYYDVTPVGRLVTRLTTDIEALNDLFSNGVVALLANGVMAVVLLSAMLRLNWHMTLVLVPIMPLFMILTVVFRGMITSSQQRARILLARINAFIAEHVNGIYVVQLFNRQMPSLRTFDGINRGFMEASQMWVTANAWFMPSVELLGNLSQAGLLVMGAYLLHTGHMTIGTLVAFLQYGNRFLRPIQQISERYGIMQTSIVSAEKVFALLDTEAMVESPVQLQAKPNSADLAFDHVWFSYKPDRWVLQDVSFRIGEGQMLAIVGHTGAGKSTISNLLLRFYEPQRGAVRLGGVNVAHLSAADLRKQFGVVLQDTYIREGTILDNIRFGADGMTEEDAYHCAQQIGLDAMLQSLPDGMYTWVQERGDNLSTGQKQMIAFARAFAHNPRLLLLDEATSNIDLETEARIRPAMSKLIQGRTSVVIAHRLATILNADCILVMHKGRVAESGSHDELMAHRGLYWRLFQIQFGENSDTSWTKHALEPAS